MTATPTRTRPGKQRLLVRQAKEWGEILTGFETHNRYEIFDEAGARVGYAAEEGKGVGAFFLRSLLGRCRAATIHLTDARGTEYGLGRKPFRWFFHRMEAYENGEKIGAIQRKFSLLHRRFVIENPRGEEVMQIDSPWLRIWTFKLMFGGREVGRVTKKWGGTLRELFTDADTFGVEFDGTDELGAMRTLLLAATFLIDFTCFENNAGGGGGWGWNLFDRG